MLNSISVESPNVEGIFTVYVVFTPLVYVIFPVMKRSFSNSHKKEKRRDHETEAFPTSHFQTNTYSNVDCMVPHFTWWYHRSRLENARDCFAFVK